MGVIIGSSTPMAVQRRCPFTRARMCRRVRCALSSVIRGCLPRICVATCAEVSGAMDGCGNSHPFSQMSSRIHRRGRLGWRDESGNPSRAKGPALR